MIQRFSDALDHKVLEKFENRKPYGFLNCDKSKYDDDIANSYSWNL
jgi:hypothetical protein